MPNLLGVEPGGGRVRRHSPCPGEALPPFLAAADDEHPHHSWRRPGCRCRGDRVRGAEALRHLPDKGGSHDVFTHLQERVSALLEECRHAGPAPVFRAKWQAPKPHVNTAFVTDLLDMADTWRIRVGEMSLYFYLKRGLASNKTVPEEY